MKPRLANKIRALSSTAFGGSLNLGKRKARRPLITEIPTHVALKASDSVTLLPQSREIENYIRSLSSKLDIKILELAIHADHIHMLPKALDLNSYNKWIRALTGNLTRKFGIRWRLQPFTSGVETEQYLCNLRTYIQKNRAEAEFMRSAHQRVRRWVQQMQQYMNP